ncbi:MAG TPA: response regulator transcription factor, partial [Dehalococcoidales bacterium]|nr:response regulator transcription factor [Dehalococcoidales bacterium]
MSNKKVLIVDDDAKIVELVKMYLVRDGYHVLTAYNGDDALKLARESRPDLLVLDIMLPGINGLEICRILRTESPIPIILLTARTTEEDRIIGLDLGADDYVTKPFSPRELAARVRAVFRRTADEIDLLGPEELKFGDLSINFKNHEARLKNQLIKLTPVEFKLLGVFVREPNRVFTRAQLVEKVLGFDFDGFDRTIDVHILNLRRKLETDSDRPSNIRTVYGSGYKFTGG